jgi:hypothetical protein
MRLANLIGAWLRKELIFKPKGRRAARVVGELLANSSIRWRKVEVSIGLQSADGLACNIFVASDAEAARARAMGLVEAATSTFHGALSQEKYPAEAIPSTRAFIHSDEEIARVGWQYWK